MSSRAASASMPAAAAGGQRSWWSVVGQVALFLAAFVPRAVYPVSRPLQWYERSFRFIEAVFQGRWEATVVSEHPGVTPMWLIGLAQHAYYGLARALGADIPSPLVISGRSFETEVAISILPLAAAIALGVLAVWWLLRRLLSEPVAWAGAGFLALDPFHLAISKVVHVDALLSVLMVLSALSVLRHLQQREAAGQEGAFWRRHRWMLASGALGGLAFLTKSPAYFLVPYVGLCLLVMQIGQSWRPAGLVRTLLAPALLWLAAAAAIYVVLWPAMWVEPVETLSTVFAGVLKHAGRPHAQPMFYLGDLVTHDPGPGFYALTVLVKSTVLSLPLAVVGLISSFTPAWKHERRWLWLLVAYGAFFFVQMSLGAKKSDRYLLPVFPALDILAGVGLATLARCMALRKPALACLVIVALLAVQAALVWPYHPYYVTYASPVVGGPVGAKRLLQSTPEGEGLDHVAHYLNGLPQAEQLRVGVPIGAEEAFRQHFVGQVLGVNDPDLDYLVFADVYIERRMAEDQWGEQWRSVRQRVPEYAVYLHGMPYARLYKAHQPPMEPAAAHLVCLGEHIRLLGQTITVDSTPLEHAVVHPGDSLWLTLRWTAMSPPAGAYTVFVHMLGPDGHTVTQQDNVPLAGTYSTQRWTPGELIDDPYELMLPEGALPGTYMLVAGMYDARTGDRLEALGDCTTILPDARIELATFEVLPNQIPWWEVLSWMAAGALLVVGVACSVGLMRSGRR